MQNPLHEIFEKDMDRKEFLVHVGAGLAAVTGVGAIVKAFTGSRSTPVGEKKSNGYGGGSYGR